MVAWCVGIVVDVRHREQGVPWGDVVVVGVAAGEPGAEPDGADVDDSLAVAHGDGVGVEGGGERPGAVATAVVVSHHHDVVVAHANGHAHGHTVSVVVAQPQQVSGDTVPE